MSSRKSHKKGTPFRMWRKSIVRLLQRNRLLAVGLITLLLLLVAFIPIPRSYTTESAISIKEIQQKTNELETGDRQLTQEGVEGLKTVAYKTNASLFDLIFRKDAIGKYDVDEKIVRQPIDGVTVIGIRKFQYMICSSGGYVSFTDEQFKSEKVGYTSKSDDYCAKNNAGVRLSLADTPTGKVLAQPTQQNSTYVDPTCRKEDVVRYASVYEDRAYLPSGTKQIGTPGRDGFTLVCPAIKGANSRTVFSVQNEIVYIGTGKTSQQVAQEQAEAEQIRQQQLLTQKRQEQMLKQSQCISSLRAQGVPESQAIALCQQEYPIP